VFSCGRILNVPRRGIGDRAEEGRGAGCREAPDLVCHRAARAAEGEVPTLATRSQRAIAGFVTCSTSALADRRREPVAELRSRLLARTGYTAELEESEDPQDESRVENLAELVTVAASSPGMPPPTRSRRGGARGRGCRRRARSPRFLERVALVADADSIPDGGDGVAP